MIVFGCWRWDGSTGGDGRLPRPVSLKIDRLERSLSMFAEEIMENDAAVRQYSRYAKRPLLPHLPGHQLGSEGYFHFGPCPMIIDIAKILFSLFLKDHVRPLSYA